jgi:hypothetical protein
VRDLLRRLFGKKSKGTMSVAIVVTHADGTVEDLGIVSQSPLEWKTEKS